MFRPPLPVGERSICTLVDYAGATHDFDDPGKSRQSLPANPHAREDALRRAAEILRSNVFVTRGAYAGRR
jgi:carboxymethylenebutenolidase